FLRFNRDLIKSCEFIMKGVISTCTHANLKGHEFAITGKDNFAGILFKRLHQEHLVDRQNKWFFFDKIENSFFNDMGIRCSLCQSRKTQPTYFFNKWAFFKNGPAFIKIVAFL